MTPSDALKGHESQGAVKTGHYAIEASVEMLESAPFDLAYNEDDAILSPRQQHRLDILDNVTASRSPRAVREVALGLGEQVVHLHVEVDGLVEVHDEDKARSGTSSR